MRQFTLIDNIISALDQSLRTLTQNPPMVRPNPARDLPEPELTSQQQQHVAGLLRVDHAGEICAQALYAGHALTARNETTKAQMRHAAEEENDHLAWCVQRLEELNSRVSYLNPFWYVGAFSMGALAGLVGDRWNLGFVAETERQVEQHLAEHLKLLPNEDTKSHAILTVMKADEAQHAENAVNAGAAEFAWPIKQAMRAMSKVMTTIAYKF